MDHGNSTSTARPPTRDHDDHGPGGGAAAAVITGAAIGAGAAAIGSGASMGSQISVGSSLAASVFSSGSASEAIPLLDMGKARLESVEVKSPAVNYEELIRDGKISRVGRFEGFLEKLN